MRWREVYAYFWLVAFLISAALIPVCKAVAVRAGLVDLPGPRKIHRAPTPLLGGLAILVSFFLVVWGHLVTGYFIHEWASVKSLVPLDFLYYFRVLQDVYPRVAIVSTGAILMFFVGLLDDRRHLSIRQRLLAEFAVATLVVLLGIRPHLEFLPDPVVWLLAIVWIVGITNAFNLLDGADGLAAGVGIISMLTLGFVLHMTQHPLPAVLLVALAGAASGFLLYNWNPASIFLGSAGSMFIGYILGTSVLLATYMTQQTTNVFPILIPVLILGIPLYDTASVILIRLVRGQSIVLADQNHLHHRLMRMGFSPVQTVLFIYLLTFCIAVNSSLLVDAGYLNSLIVLVQNLGIFLMLVVIERVSMKRAREAGARDARPSETGASAERDEPNVVPAAERRGEP